MLQTDTIFCLPHGLSCCSSEREKASRYSLGDIPHPVRLAESPEKARIILEAVGEADLADLLVHHDGVSAGGWRFFVRMD